MRFTGLLYSMVLALVLVATNHAASRPHVLLVCVDDLKPALGCYGDSLALAYCNQAVCAPSRNALLAGLRPQTLGIYDLGTNFRRSVPNAVTLPQYFKQHGYRTEALGKIFHVGHGNHEDPQSWSVPHFSAKTISYALPENRAELTREGAFFENKNPATLPKGAAYEAADVPDNDYGDGKIADEAVRRLQAAVARPDEPFFLAVGFLKPHLPFCAPQRYWDLYDRGSFPLAALKDPPGGAPSYAPQFGGELRNYKDIPAKGALDDDLQRTLIHGYYAAMSYMDAQLGRVLDTLEETGLSKNTIILLWGDHGWHLGDHGMWCKHTNYEQAARIPLVVRLPAEASKQPVQRATSAMVETVDIYPTLCELAGLPAPAGLDGRSFAATLKELKQNGRDHVIHVYPRGGRLGRAIRTPHYRLVQWKQPGAADDAAEWELYDYQSDPLETKNLIDELPEVAASLRKLLAAHPEAKASIAEAAKRS
jgi:iduronate 2-sulfatase